MTTVEVVADDGLGLYQKVPVVVRAMRWTGDNLGRVVFAFPGMKCRMHPDVAPGVLYIHTLEGRMAASPGDWIIEGVNGEFYPCKPDIFHKTYREVERRAT